MPMAEKKCKQAAWIFPTGIQCTGKENLLTLAHSNIKVIDDSNIKVID